jgi:hypothetical protein
VNEKVYQEDSEGYKEKKKRKMKEQKKERETKR